MNRVLDIVSRRFVLSLGASLFVAAKPATYKPPNAPPNLESWIGSLRPEWFGAKGDGHTNDTNAFAALTAFVNRRGGGVIEFRATTYIVGSQRRSISRDAMYSYDPQPILEFNGCTRPLVLNGNGARLRCEDGLRYGTFDPFLETAVDHGSPYYGTGVAAPYGCMIKASRCNSDVVIRDFELDGNAGALVVGGPYGDAGWQLPASGIGLYDNAGQERLANIYTHHHALDGIIIDGTTGASPGSHRSITNLRSEYNGRQGCSIVGGAGYRFRNCSFSHTGKGRLFSAPSAGVDIEAENGKTNRDHSFEACTFSDNRGVGLLAAEGDNAGLVADRCVFIGSSNWTAWPHLPRASFDRCTFVGPIVNAFGSAQADLATKFLNCLFLDDPALSPTRQLYVGQNATGPIVDFYDHPNVLFKGCTFRLKHDAVLPWVTRGTIFEDCYMEQASSSVSYPRGTYLGRNIVHGRVDVYSANVVGVLIVNGKVIPKGIQ